MKKLIRAIKLRRNLVRIYRCIFHRRRRPTRTAYLRLRDPTSSPTCRPPKPTAAGRVLTWGRVFTKLLLSINAVHRVHNQLSSNEGKQPSKPPKGYLVVYVGNWEDGCPEPRRYLVPVVYFNHPLFEELLSEAEEVYGFHHPGGITIPCAVSDFEEVRMRVAAANEKVGKKLLCF